MSRSASASGFPGFEQNRTLARMIHQSLRARQNAFMHGDLQPSSPNTTQISRGALAFREVQEEFYFLRRPNTTQISRGALAMRFLRQPGASAPRLLNNPGWCVPDDARAALGKIATTCVSASPCDLTRKVDESSAFV